MTWVAKEFRQVKRRLRQSRMRNPPKNASEVRSFVQLVQYSSKFIPNFSQVAEPLRKLLRKDQDFIWGVKQQKAFEELKSLMKSAKALAYFRGDCKTRIVADAGPDGLGAVLLQFQEGEWRAVSCASRNLTEVERRYAQTEKEALAPSMGMWTVQLVCVWAWLRIRDGPQTSRVHF